MRSIVSTIFAALVGALFVAGCSNLSRKDEPAVPAGVIADRKAYS